MKSDTVFKRASNELLDRLAQGVPGGGLESEAKLAEAVRVSRTTIRKALRELTRRRVLKRRDAKLVIARRPTKNDYFPMADTIAASDRVERKLMEWISRGGRKPGDYVNGLELARDFGVSTSAVREYLSRFERYGLVEKRPNSGWIFRGFTPDFALELFEVRELFEIRSAKAFAAQPRGAPAWEALAAIEAEHLRLRKDIKWRYQDFSSLDERFHRLIYDASRSTETLWVAPYRETSPLAGQPLWGDLARGTSGTIGGGFFAHVDSGADGLQQPVHVVDLTDGSRRTVQIPYTLPDGSGWRITGDPTWVSRDELAFPAGRISSTDRLQTVLRIDLTALPVEPLPGPEAGVDGGM